MKRRIRHARSADLEVAFTVSAIILALSIVTYIIFIAIAAGGTTP